MQLMKQCFRLEHGARWLITPVSLLHLVAALACNSDEVSIGAGEIEGGENSACGDGLVAGDITVSAQAQIDALAGCEEIEGDLSIVGFPGIDLLPLASLRVVGSTLFVGAVIDGSSDEPARDPVPIPSLAGLERLERVGNLQLQAVSAPDLSALANLATVGRDLSGPWDDDGSVDIRNCDQLRDLSGLEKLAGWNELDIAENAALESLDGLRDSPWTLDRLSLRNLPSLRDISALAATGLLERVVISNTGLENVDGLSVLGVASLTIEDNPELRNLDGLNGISVTSISVQGNAKLERLPDLMQTAGLETMRIIDNAELKTLPRHDGSGIPVDYRDGEYVPVSFRVVEIANNPKLVQAALPTELPLGEYVGIYGNDSLTRFELGALRSVDLLLIRDNAALTEVGLGDVTTVDNLEVVNNPLLSTAAFAEVQAFTREMSGNMDAD